MCKRIKCPECDSTNLVLVRIIEEIYVNWDEDSVGIYISWLDSDTEETDSCWHCIACSHRFPVEKEIIIQ